MTTLLLKSHPDTQPLDVTSIDVECWHDGARWCFRYLLKGAPRLVLPDSQEPGRANGLWQTTCFEAFVGGDGAAYHEYNFSPSAQWAAYAFDAPRTNMRHAVEEVEVWLDRGGDWLAVAAAISADFLPGSPLGLSAVIEEEGGVKSYWALAHPDGPPDFHNRDCFVASLPPVVTS